MSSLLELQVDEWYEGSYNDWKEGLKQPPQWRPRGFLVVVCGRLVLFVPLVKFCLAPWVLGVEAAVVLDVRGLLYRGDYSRYICWRRSHFGDCDQGGDDQDSSHHGRCCLSCCLWQIELLLPRIVNASLLQRSPLSFVSGDD